MMRFGLLCKIYVPHGVGLKTPLAKSRFLPQHERLKKISFRKLTYTIHLRQHDRPVDEKAAGQAKLRPERSESIKPESYQEGRKAKPMGPPKTDALLSEQTASNKEQRKIDMAIMKEMARYLWPKVWLV